MFTAYRFVVQFRSGCAGLHLHSKAFHRARMNVFSDAHTPRLGRTCTELQDGAGSYPGNRSDQIGGVDLLAAKLCNLAPQPKDDDPIRDLKHESDGFQFGT
jgi:hypothetical protein